MGFEIDARRVRWVLIGDDWYEVESGSFMVNEYVFKADNLTLNAYPNGSSPTLAFTFVTKSGPTLRRVSGPLASVRAMREDLVSTSGQG